MAFFKSPPIDGIKNLGLDENPWVGNLGQEQSNPALKKPDPQLLINLKSLHRITHHKRLN